MKYILMLTLLLALSAHAEEYHQYDKYGNKLSHKESIVVEGSKVLSKDRFGNTERHKGYYKAGKNYDKFGNRNPNKPSWR